MTGNNQLNTHSGKDADPVHLLEVGGRIDASSARELIASLEDAMSAQSPQVILDMSGVEFMNSAGVREIVRLHEEVKQRGGRLQIANPSDRVRRIFSIVGLNNLFNLVEDAAIGLGIHSRTGLVTRSRRVVYFS